MGMRRGGGAGCPAAAPCVLPAPRLRILGGEGEMKKKAKKKQDTRYAHEEHYCMIRPAGEEDVASTGES